MTKSKLEKSIENKENNSEELNDFLNNAVKAKGEIEAIQSMKASDGWKIIDKKVREELSERINELVKDDPKIMTLIALLKVADTKSMSQLLDKAIDEALPE